MQMTYGFWIRTRQDPPRAVRWEPQVREDGTVTNRGRGWVEVLPHGATREAERFLAADVELAGPHEWLSYYPGPEEPVCGWGRPRLPRGNMQYCPRQRAGDDPFCKKHMAELEGSEGEEEHDREADGDAHTE